MRRLQTLVGTLAAICFILQISQSHPLQARRGFEIADYYRTAFPESLDVSPDGKHVVSAGIDEEIRIWTPRLD